MLTTTEEAVLNPAFFGMQQCRIEILGDKYPEDIGSLRIYGHPDIFDKLRNAIESYEELLLDSIFLDALSAAGVDNWEGYAEAKAIYKDMIKEYEFGNIQEVSSNEVG